MGRYDKVPLMDFSHYTTDAPSVYDKPDVVVKAYGRRYTAKTAPEGTPVRIARSGETLAHIAGSEYGNTGLWWFIADYNPHVFDPVDVQDETELVIPPITLLR